VDAIAHKALEEKEIDFYPEYTGTMLAVLKQESMTDRKAVYDKVKSEYAAKGLVVLNETPFQNTYNMVVRPETAAQYKLETLSDLAKVSKELLARTRVPRPQGRTPGLKAKYGWNSRKTCRWRSGFATGVEGRSDPGRQRLLDRWHDRRDEVEAAQGHKGLWPPYYVVPVVRKDALDANPKIAEVLNRVSAMIDESAMAEMNYKVDGEKMEPRTSHATF
jgi:osmoprotectant transport system substrate-binding protein